MFCAAINSSGPNKGKECKSGISSRCTVQVEEWIYHFCQNHMNTWNRHLDTRVVDSITKAPFRLSTERRHLKTVSTEARPESLTEALREQGELFPNLVPSNALAIAREALHGGSDQDDTVTLFVRRIVQIQPDKLLCVRGGKQWTGTLEEFKALCRNLLAKSTNADIKGFCALYGNRVLMFTRENGPFITNRNIFTAPGTNRTYGNGRSSKRK